MDRRSRLSCHPPSPISGIPPLGSFSAHCGYLSIGLPPDVDAVVEIRSDMDLVEGELLGCASS